jgi:acetyl-CoA decarbonylase/synthase complex subunit epsilon
MGNNDPWMIAEVAGPRKASVITKAEVAEAIIRRARRPLLVIGNLAAEIEVEDRMLVDYLVLLARKGRIPVVATAQIGKDLLKRDLSPDRQMAAVDIAQRLADPSWRGVDGKGPHDLVMFAGLPYYLTQTVLSGLKHFAPSLKTMTLDNVYHPQANWSLSNLSLRDWATILHSVIENLEE